MMATWPTGPSPIVGNTVNTSFRTKRTVFGDGYEEITQSGINPKFFQGSLLFPGLTQAQLNTYVDFLDARMGVESFDIQLPGESAATTVLVEGYSFSPSKGSRWELSVTYRRFYPNS